MDQTLSQRDPVSAGSPLASATKVGLDEASTPTATPPASATVTATPDGSLEDSNSREGHRPLLTPGQALFLARELYGIRTAPAAGQVRCSGSTLSTHGAGEGGGRGSGCSPPMAIAGGTDGTATIAGVAGSAIVDAVCTELPSYDDRNFHISASGKQVLPRRLGPGRGGTQDKLHRQPQEQPALQSRVQPPAPPAHQQKQQHLELSGGKRSNQGATRAPVREEAKEEEVVSVVLKVHNTQDSHRISQLQAMDEAMLRLLAAGVLTNAPLRPAVGHHHCTLAAGGADAADEVGGSSSGSNNNSTSSDEVPYQVLLVSEQEEPGAEPVLCCWASLPCTCHPLEPEDHTEGRVEEAGEAGGLGTASEPPATGPVASIRPARQSNMTHTSNEKQEDPGRRSGRRSHWHVVRCLSYVPGKMLSSVPYLTPALLLSLGRLMGRVTCGLAGWHPSALQRCSHDWYPENGSAVLRRLVPGIQAFDQEQRSLLLRVSDELLAASTRLSDPRVLPRQLCHADANDDNCVVSEEGGEVIGLIDFGDMAIMPRVCEVAIAMLYAVLLGLKRPMVPPAPAGMPRAASTSGAGPVATGTATAIKMATWDQQAAAYPGVDGEESGGFTLRRLLRVAGLVLCGYQQLVPLQPGELAVLPLLLRGRLAQSLALGAASVVADPGNADYLLATQRPGWRVIRLLTPGSVMTDKEMLQLMLMARVDADAAEDRL